MIFKEEFHPKVTERNKLIFVRGSELVTKNTVPLAKAITELDMISIILGYCYNITLQMLPSNKAERMAKIPVAALMARFSNGSGRVGTLAEILDIVFSFRSCGNTQCSFLQLTSLLTIYYPHLTPS